MKKGKRMIIAGIVLWAVQLIAIFGAVMTGRGWDIIFGNGSMASMISRLIGFMLFGIVGSILLVIGYVKTYNKND